jgi:ribonuclease VapC
MVIDTSAIIAAITGEPDCTVYRDAIQRADTRLISAVTLLETQIVLFARLGPEAIAALDELIDKAAIKVVPFDEVLAKAAFEAFSEIRQRARAPGAIEHHRLRRLRSRQHKWPPVAFQGT